MQLFEAAQLFVKLMQDCSTLEGYNIMFTPSKPEVEQVEGYKIQITKGLEIDKETLLCMENFVKIHGLTYLKEKKQYLFTKNDKLNVLEKSFYLL